MPRLRTFLAASPTERAAVGRLRHAIYVDQMGLLPADHPYAVGGVLEDPYDARSLQLALCDGDTLIGTARITCARDGRLEVEEARSLDGLGVERDRLCEVTRVMIHRDHRGFDRSLALFSGVFDAMRAAGCHQLLAAGKVGSLGRYYQNMGLKLVDPEPFAYPIIPGCTYQLLLGDFGRPGTPRGIAADLRTQAVRAAGIAAPGLIWGWYRRGLRTPPRERRPAEATPASTRLHSAA